MFRSLIFAIGIFLLIFGAQTLLVDKWIMSYELPAQVADLNTNNVAGNNYYGGPYRSASFSRNRSSYGQPVAAAAAASTIKPVYQTRDWMPWSLLAGGAMIVLYTYSGGRRGGE